MLEHIDNSLMERVYVSVGSRLQLNLATSKGNQIKWFCDSKFIKLNTYTWYEGLSEVLVSHLLKFTNIANFVTYFPCIIIEDGNEIGEGCYSYNYLGEGEQDITFYRLLKNCGYNLSDSSYDSIRDMLLDVTGVDFKSYIDKCLCIDSITFNEDRHFNNLSLVRKDTNYFEAPVYDNGLSCLSDIFTYPLSDNLDVNLRKVYAKPFKVDFKQQVKEAHVTPILINEYDFLNSVQPRTDEEIRAFHVIKAGLKKMEGISWERF